METSLENRLKKSKIGIITHTFATGPGQELETYLKGKVKELTFIGHPLPFCENLSSVFKKYNQKGKLIKEKKTGRPLPELLLYLQNAILTFYWLIFAPKKNLVIGVDGFNAFCAWLIKKIGKAEKVVFYTIDYVPQRFKNPLLNKIYHLIDSFSVRHCDYVWNLSPVMIKEREKKGVEKKYRKKQITVPIGTNLNVKRLPFEKINRYEIAFMGHLRPGQGAEFLLKTMPEVLKKIPQLSLVFIGTGPLEKTLKRKALKLKINKKVKFTGFIKSHTKMQTRLSQAAIAIAPYVDDKKNYTRYTDPGKPKAYLASGLPVIITDIVQIAKDINKNKAGIAISFQKKALIKAIISLLKSGQKLKIYRKNALWLAKKFSWEKIFKKALKETL